MALMIFSDRIRDMVRLRLDLRIRSHIGFGVARFGQASISGQIPCRLLPSAIVGGIVLHVVKNAVHAYVATA